MQAIVELMMLVTFRSLSLVEGVSLVSLFGVAIPLRVYLNNTYAVPLVGMTHGVLFLAYFLMSLMVSHRERWSVARWSMVLLAGFIPFAFLWLERRLREWSAASASPQY